MLDSAFNYWYCFLFFAYFPDRFAMLANNNLQILNINKSDEGIYRCEGRVEARGEIDFRDIIVIVNGKQRIICMYFIVAFSKMFIKRATQHLRLINLRYPWRKLPHL